MNIWGSREVDVKRSWVIFAVHFLFYGMQHFSEYTTELVTFFTKHWIVDTFLKNVDAFYRVEIAIWLLKRQCLYQTSLFSSKPGKLEVEFLENDIIKMIPHKFQNDQIFCKKTGVLYKVETFSILVINF